MEQKDTVKEEEKEISYLDDPNNEITNPSYITKIKEIFNRDYQKILPKDLEKLKQMNEALYAKYGDLSKIYNSTLSSLHSQNDQIKNKAKEYYQQYKQIKREIYNMKNDLIQKRKYEQTEDELMSNDIKKSLNSYEAYESQRKAMKDAIGISPQEEPKETQEDKEISTLINILRKLNNLGVDVSKAAGPNEEDIQRINFLIGLNAMDKQKNENEGELNEGELNEKIKETLSNVLGKEKEFNLRNIENNNYEYEDEKMKISFKIRYQDGNLFVDNDTLEEWSKNHLM